MFGSRGKPVFVAATITMLATILSGGAASAEPPVREPVYFEYGPGISFCGQPFIQQGFVEGWSTTFTRRGVTYTSEHLTGTDTWTNAITGERVFVDTRSNGKALRVTDNGDGTYTIVVQNVGNTVAYTEDGTVLDRSAGLFRFALTFDDAGTPGDEEDDEVVDFEVLKGVTGREYDLCAVLEETIA